MYSFNITILGEGHPLSPGWQGPGRYFNPPSPCGKGRTPTMAIFAACTFQSTLPVWEGTRWNPLWRLHAHDFNPPSPCGEGRADAERLAGVYDVSIHPPRVGRDTHATPPYSQEPISIHPPRVGRDGRMCRFCRWQKYFNPPSPCGEGPTTILCRSSIDVFQSTLPVWGGTGGTTRAIPFPLISIHPPRVGRDPGHHQRGGSPQTDFNPPSPCGEGQSGLPHHHYPHLFQSTLPVWGGTYTLGFPVLRHKISIHPPRVGRDFCVPPLTFYCQRISIHPPRVGRDSKSSQKFFVNFCARR